jgi:hypothetical protein
MGRKLFGLLAGAALIFVFAEGLVVGVLWAKGRLTPDVVQEIRDILREPSLATPTLAKPEESKAPQVTTVDDVVRVRALRILQIEQRERDQQVLKGLVADSRNIVQRDREAITKQQDDYLAQKKADADRANSAAITQARSVLLKTDTTTMLDHLQKMPLDESIALVKGMPEKKIAEILQAFAAGDPKSAKRGQELFQAISQGNPNMAQPATAAAAKN